MRICFGAMGVNNAIHYRCWVVGVLAGFVVAAFAVAAPANAAEFNIPDGDVAALRAALATAEGNGESDTINLPANATYTFVDKTPRDYDYRCALTFGGSENSAYTLTINGNGATLQRSAAPGTPEFRVLCAYPNHVVSILLNDLTMRNGLASSKVDNDAGDIPLGGAILSFYADLHLSRCIVTDNHAVSVDPYQGSTVGANGGAIANVAGGLSLVDSQVTNNSATGPVFDPAFDPHAGATAIFEHGTFGGGIFSYFSILNGRAVTISGSTITGNQALGGANGGPAAGGGIFSLADTLSIQDSTICNNVARGGDAQSELFPSGGGAGGGLVVVNGATLGVGNIGSASIASTTFCNNAAQAGSPAEASNFLDVIGYPCAGGGVVLATSATLDGCTITGNSAPGGRGGGLLTAVAPAYGAPGSTIGTNLNIFGNTALLHPDVDDPLIPEPPTPTPTVAAPTNTPIMPTATPVPPNECVPPNPFLEDGVCVATCSPGRVVDQNNVCQALPPTSTPTNSPTVTPTVTEVLPTATAVAPTATPILPTATTTPAYVPVTCPATPSGTCVSSRLGSLLIRDHTDDSRDRISWQFGGGREANPADFGNPLTGSGYALCLYDGTNLAVDLRIEPGTPQWRPRSTGFNYAGNGGNQYGVSGVRLRSGRPSHPASRVVVQAGGTALPLPAPVGGGRFFVQTLAVTAQFHQANGRCYSTTFGAADTIRNGAKGFHARFVQP